MNIKRLIKDKKTRAVILAFITGVTLLVMAGGFSSGGEKKKSLLINETKRVSESTARSLENRLSEVISAIKGISGVKVMVTMEESSALVLAANTETGNGGIRQDILLEGSNKVPVVIKETEPKVRGVVVVAKGVESEGMKYKIWQAVKAVTNAPASRIEIQEGK